MLEAYLDIETTGLSPTYHNITVIGIYITGGNNDRFVQSVGEEVTKDNLLEALRGVDVIYTYNGSRFDLPFINASLGVDLAKDFKHHDLMLDYPGGLKPVETRLGIDRQQKGIDGAEAVRLWRKWKNQRDRNALNTLLHYNKEDVVNLKTLRNKLEELSSKAQAVFPEVIEEIPASRKEEIEVMEEIPAPRKEEKGFKEEIEFILEKWRKSLPKEVPAARKEEPEVIEEIPALRKEEKGFVATLKKVKRWLSSSLRL